MSIDLVQRSDGGGMIAKAGKGRQRLARAGDAPTGARESSANIMNYKDILSENRSNLVKKWIGAVIDAYPKDSRRFFHKEKNRFANPIGQTIAEEVERLFDELIGGEDDEKIASSLDAILRIQAIQDFAPSRAISFVFSLKGLVRDTVKGSAAGAFRDLDERMDRLALQAFDVYAGRRQKLYELRVNEVKRELSRLLQRANLVVEIPDMGSGQ
ncbi:MAG: RsbRD N-terminal domain-containing protein [Deltaproteobacteria bacterium]|nr:RsbRD N-terminal domain-containing protein [Deltaproteobacteria bacterium]